MLKYPKVNYIGNKEKIASWICGQFPDGIETVLDAFSGGCSLSYEAKTRGYQVLSNDILHMAIGVAGEAGELLDAIKKFVVYQKTLDVENVVEELGDLEFYMQGLRSALNIKREETISHCTAKLSVRYSGLKYSNEAAQHRADKIEGE